MEAVNHHHSRVLAGDLRRQAKMSRLTACNELISAISVTGRRFFDHSQYVNLRGQKGTVSRLEMGSQGHIYFVDGYSQKRIYTHYPYGWRGFSEGGTLKALIEAMRDYIRTGKRIHPGHLGPWPDWCCNGDLWGYGDAMTTVRDKAKELGIIE